MKTLSLPLAVTLFASVLLNAGCSDCPPTNSACNTGVGGGSGSGGGGGSVATDLYDLYTLDSKMSDRFYMDMVVDKSMGKSRVGIVYVAGQGEG